MTRLVLAVALGVLVLAAGWLARAGMRRFRRGREWRVRVTVEDALKHLYGAEERGRTATIESLAGQLGVAVRRAGEIARLLHERGLAVTADPGAFALTAAGRRAAEQVVRAHRLWERYLADELNVPIAELHRRADRQEHLLGAEDVGRLAAALGHPQRDPHGDPIPPPTATAAREATPGWPVTLAARGVTAQIQHLEDEPEDVFARLAAQELEVGQRVTVRDRASDRLTLDVDGRQIELSPVDAANIFVVPVLEEVAPPGRTLADLQTGERATLRRVNVRGFGRRRLFDLGFTPGVVVECAFAAAFGQPRAYRVRGTTIALRAEQARRIEVDPVPARTP